MVAARRLRAAAMAVAALLAGAGAALLLGHAAAQATPELLGVPLPGTVLSVPSTTLSVPGLTVSVPSTTVSVAGTTVSLPATTVSSPELTASSPSVSAPAPPPAPVSTTPTSAATSSPSSPSRGVSGSPTLRASAASVSSPTGASVGASVRASPSRTPAAGAAAGRGSARAPSSGRGSRGTLALVAARPSTRRAPASRSALVTAARSSGNPLDAIGRNLPLPLPVPDWSKPIILALILLALGLGLRSRSSASRARRLEAQRAVLLEDVDVMQQTLVPELPARVGGLATSVAYRPADGPAAGGDFYDLFVPAPGTVAIILGDVAGHGRHALERAALTRYTVRAYLQAGLEPRAALALAGRALADPSAASFATVAAAVYDAAEGTLVYASAGHPAPILTGVSEHQPIELCCSPPVGWDVPTGRRQTTVSLPAGAVACFFSDGLLEARCGEDLLGRERLAEMIAGLGPRPRAARLLEEVRACADSTPDDMAACILVADSGCRALLYIEDLEVDAETLKGPEVHRFLEACGVSAHRIRDVMADAERMTAGLGTAVLRVARAPSGAAATASAQRPSASGHAPPAADSQPDALSVG